MRAANEPPGHLGDVITTYAQTLSGFGQIAADGAAGQAGDPAEILFPPALLAGVREGVVRLGGCRFGA